MASKWIVFILVIASASHAASREVSLSEIFTNQRQEGMQHVQEGRNVSGEYVEKFGSDLGEIISHGYGSSNAILVDANDIDEAVRASRHVLCGYRPADILNIVSTSKAKMRWLTVYLGVGHSSPAKFTAIGASVDGNTIRFTYRKPRPRWESEDDVYYFYWLPIGNLDDGVYTLELYDAEAKATTFTRRVEVKTYTR